MSKTRVIPLANGEDKPDERRVAVETAVNVVCGGIPFAVMMLTPSDLEDFAFGFALTEGIIDTAEDLRGVAIKEEELGIVLDLDLAPHRLHAHLARRRALSGRTGCGVCGIDDLAAVRRADIAGRDVEDAPVIRP
ncbi:MAG: formate dehydrogenase accessory sulfurtransferase FdhD, partial [Methylobacteriaceae bacterium]|nr:formate dehydrogenase accessory sulfurtransferase FdhD [Methylobacteriaceae bacterium]